MLTLRLFAASTVRASSDPRLAASRRARIFSWSAYTLAASAVLLGPASTSSIVTVLSPTCAAGISRIGFAT